PQGRIEWLDSIIINNLNMAVPPTHRSNSLLLAPMGSRRNSNHSISGLCEKYSSIFSLFIFFLLLLLQVPSTTRPACGIFNHIPITQLYIYRSRDSSIDSQDKPILLPFNHLLLSRRVQI